MFKLRDAIEETHGVRIKLPGLFVTLVTTEWKDEWWQPLREWFYQRGYETTPLAIHGGRNPELIGAMISIKASRRGGGK